MKAGHLFSFITLIIALALVFSLASCSTKSKADKYYGGAEDNRSDAPYEDGEKGNDEEGSETQKIVKTCSMTVEATDFDTAVQAVYDKAEESGGYIEKSNVKGESINSEGTLRTASFTVRVPADNFDGYINSISGAFNVTNKSSTTTDITESYYTAKSKLTSLETQESRLLEMLKGSDKLEYMLQIEDKLADIRSQIEYYNSMVKVYEKAVSYATITISLSEVVKYTDIVEAPKNFGERVSQAFSESWKSFAEGWQDLTVGLVYAFPTLLVLALIAVIIALIIFFSARSSRRRRAKANGEYMKRYGENQTNGNNNNNTQK